MKHIVTILVLSSLFFLNSCNSKKIIEENKVSAELAHLPNWVLNPNLEDSIAAVGISPKNRGGLRFQIPQAEADARANIAAQINTEISRLTKDALRSADISGNQDVESTFSQVTKALIKKVPLRGAKRINMYKDPTDGSLYIHMSLDNEMILNYFKQKKQLFANSLQANNIARDNLDKAEKAVEKMFNELDKELAN
jgi:hypothetical protein